MHPCKYMYVLCIRTYSMYLLIASSALERELQNCTDVDVGIVFSITIIQFTHLTTADNVLAVLVNVNIFNPSIMALHYFSIRTIVRK